MGIRLGSVAAAIGVALALSPARAPAQAPGQTLDCVIHPELIVAVAAPVEGLLDKVLVDRGDLVKEGQELATLESSVERVNVLLARARVEQEAALKSGRTRLEFGVRRYDRTLELFRKEMVPTKEMDEAETAKILAEHELLQAAETRRVAEIELERATAALTLRTVRSPVTGVVIERLLAAGEFAKQSPIVRIARIDPLRVEVIVPVAQLGRVRVGGRAEIVPEAPVSGAFPATITVVDRVIDAASGTFGVRLSLPNPDYRLPAGLRCGVRFLDGAPARKPGR
jgi:RND family efflux transporter MFP subunit